MIAANAISPLSATVATLAIGAIYALHHLRSRPQRRRVASLLFWGASSKVQQTRVLMSRNLSHPKTFLFLTAIVALLSLALSADRWVSDRDVLAVDVVVVDIGTVMAAPGSDGQTLLRDAADRIRTDVRRMRRTPKLIVAGPQPVLLSPGDEPIAVLDRRLDLLEASSQGSAPLLALQLAGQLSSEKSKIYWYTAGTELPEGILPAIAPRILRVQLETPAEAAAIVAATFEPVNDGGSTGTLKVKIAGHFSKSLSLVVRNKADVVVRQATVAPQAEPIDVAIPALSADGSELSIFLENAPGSPLEHTISLRLPNQPALKFYIAGVIPNPLRSALLAVGQLSESPRSCVVVVAGGTAAPDGGIGVIEVVPSSTAHASGHISIASALAEQLGDIDFEGATALGAELPTTEATPVLMAGITPAATLAKGEYGQRLFLASSLVDESADLPRHAAFPVLIGQLARSMFGWQPGTAAVLQTRHALDPLWQAKAGVSYVYDAPNTAVANLQLPTTPAATGKWDVFSWTPFLIVIGLASVVIEGVLVTKKKIV